jgi:hypothetical protein
MEATDAALQSGKMPWQVRMASTEVEHPVAERIPDRRKYFPPRAHRYFEVFEFVLVLSARAHVHPLEFPFTF